MKYLESFDDIISKQEKKLFGNYEHGINDYIDEALSISFDVREMSYEILDIIITSISEKKMPYINESGHETFYIKHASKIRNQDLYMMLKVINLEKTNKNYSDYISQKTHFKIQPVSKNSYSLNGTIVLVRNKLTEITKEVIIHEISHMWMYMNEFDDLSDDDVDKILTSRVSYNITYNNSVNIINHPDKNYPEHFYELCQVIYACDKQEISSFMQQAYQKIFVSKCQTYTDMDNEIRKTDLYKYGKIISDFVDLIESGFDITKYIKKNKPKQ